jgi:hypothetical protein
MHRVPMLTDFIKHDRGNELAVAERLPLKGLRMDKLDALLALRLMHVHDGVSHTSVRCMF